MRTQRWQRGWVPACSILALVLALTGESRWAWAAPQIPPPSTRPARATASKPLTELIQAKLQLILDQAEQAPRLDEAVGQLNLLFAQVAAHVPHDQVEVFVEVASVRRLVSHLARAEPARQGPLLKYLRAHPALARALAFTIDVQADKPRDVFVLLDRLIDQRGGQVDLDRYANLVAAICVVHDKPLVQRINENQATSDDPLALFDYYVRNESKLLYGVQQVPSELLIYVVDTTSTVTELEWALEQYRGERRVGALFFRVKYDTNHYRRGAPKQVTLKGFSLPNILRYGGVCADQAYFATEVGKAIGVPTAYTVGRNGQMSHAWVGFFESSQREGWWNFNMGRYAEYRGLRGHVRDPQTRRAIPDSYVSLLAEMVYTRPLDHQVAAAMTDAASLLITLDRNNQALDVPVPADVPASLLLKTPRKADTLTSLALLEAGLRRFPAYADGWLALRVLASGDKLSLAQKRQWADLILRLCGRKYPDFALDVLEPMIQTVPNIRDQDAMWEGALAIFTQRPDLCAEIRMAQAKMWEDGGDLGSAARCYLDVAQRYANAGPFVVTALNKAEKLLRQMSRENDIPTVYEQAWSKMDRPAESIARDQSNWYRVGVRYVAALESLGRQAEAAKVQARIDQVMRR